MPQNEYNGILYFLPIQYSHNSSLKIAYSEEYDNSSFQCISSRLSAHR